MHQQDQIALYRNGIIHSTADPYASAMLVENGHVAWVGGEEAASSLADTQMRVIDLEGGFIAPSFVDSHVHLTETGLGVEQVDLSTAASAQDMLAKVADWADARPDAELILGRSWDHSWWQDITLPTAQELSNAAGGRVVVLDRVDLHSGLFSSAALQAAGIDSDEAWHAEDDYTAIRAAVLNFDAKKREYFQRQAIRQFHANGYTAAAQMGTDFGGGDTDYTAFAALVNDSELGFDLYGYKGHLITEEDQISSLQQQWGSALTGIGGDLCIDGSIGSGTALLRDPYAVSDQGPQNRGEQLLTETELETHLRLCTSAGVQTAFHVIGDGALEVLLNTLEKVEQATGLAAIQRCAHRIEHLEMATGEDIKRIARFGLVASMQPLFDHYWAADMYELRLGAERASLMNPVGQLLAEGVLVAFGSDTPVTHINGWDSIAAAMNLRNTNAQISARAGFKAHTMSGYRAVGESRPMAGMLVPGARADFAIWDADELTVQSSASRAAAWSTDVRSRTPLLPVLEKEGNRPKLRETFHAGRRVYQA